MTERAPSPTDAGAWRFYGIAALVAATLGVWLIGELPGHLFNATRFILYDPGSYLYAVGRWQSGEVLYRDLAWQYGPLALGWYRAFASLGGNTPLTLVVAATVAFGIGWALIARLVARAAGRVAGWGFAGLVLLPVMLASGPLMFNGPHGALEILLLAACAWALAADAEGRSPGWRLGVLVGLLQWVRFGPHVVALVAILAITAWRRWPGRSRGEYFRDLAAFAGRLLAGYLLVLAPLAAWYFQALPAAGAWEQLWPSHMVAHYAGTYPDRWPEVASWREFSRVWMPAVLAIGLALAVLARGFAGTRNPVAAKTAPMAGLLFFPLYYLFASGLLFRNGYAFGGHLWVVWPGLALILVAVPSRWGRAVLLVLALPALVTVWQGINNLVATEQAWHARPVSLPNGQQLWFHGSEERSFAALATELEGVPEGRRTAVFLAGGGVHHFFRAPRVGRHWWYLPEFVRPWEMARAEKDLLAHERLFVADLGQGTGPGAGTVTLWLPLPEEISATLLPHLKNPRRVGTIGIMVDVAP